MPRARWSRCASTDDCDRDSLTLGLVTNPSTFDAYAEDGFADGVVEFYDSTDGIVRVHDAGGTDRSVRAAARLVHALQDQVVRPGRRRAQGTYYDDLQR